MDELKAACNILLGREVFTNPKSDPGKALAYLPVPGLLLGILAFVLAALLLLASGVRPTAGALLGAVAVPTLLWYLTRGQGPNGTIHVLENLFTSGAANGAGRNAIYWTLCAFQALVALRILAIGLLMANGAHAWLILAPTLGAAALGELLRSATGTARPATGHPYLNWILTATVTLAVGALVQALLGALIALALTWLLVPVLGRTLTAHGGGLDAPACRAGAEVLETLVLLVGVLFALHAVA
jgi:hypothetical protein